jgi:hypothetical protein
MVTVIPMLTRKPRTFAQQHDDLMREFAFLALAHEDEEGSQLRDAAAVSRLASRTPLGRSAWCDHKVDAAVQLDFPQPTAEV